jgi:DinB superfamily
MDAFLADFRQTVDSAAERLRAVSEPQAEAQMIDGAWSAKQIIGHLIDSAANNHPRFVRAQFIDHLDFPGYDQEQWVSAQDYQAAPWPALIGLWQAYNLHLAHVVAGIPPDTLRAPRARHSLDRIAWQTLSASEPATLDYLVRDYLGHLKDHLHQLFAALAA